MKRFILFQIIVLAVITDSNSQDFSTIGEIYDFEVGDEFQYYGREINSLEDDTTYYLSRKIITEKAFENDALIYFRKIDEFTCDYNQPFPQTIDTLKLDSMDMVTYYDPDSFMLYLDKVYSDPDLYNGRKINIQKIAMPNYFSTNIYVDGCGFVKHRSFNTIHATSYFDSLIYFRKGYEEWGTKILMDIHENLIENDIQIYPNPVKDKLMVTIKNRNSNFTEIYLINALGIHSPACYKYSESNVLQIDCSNLSKGFYYIVFTMSGKITTRSLIKF